MSPIIGDIKYIGVCHTLGKARSSASGALKAMKDFGYDSSMKEKTLVEKIAGSQVGDFPRFLSDFLAILGVEKLQFLDQELGSSEGLYSA